MIRVLESKCEYSTQQEFRMLSNIRNKELSKEQVLSAFETSIVQRFI